MNQYIIEDEFDKIINQISHDIHTLFDDLISSINLNGINLEFDKMLQYEIISQNDDENIYDDNDIIIPNNQTKNYTGILYDIYYYFLLKKKEGHLEEFTLSNFNYPHSFTFGINDTYYSIKVTSVNNECNDVCTVLLYKNNVIRVPSYGYENEYKKQSSYNCIMNELFKIKKLIYENKIKVY